MNIKTRNFTMSELGIENINEQFDFLNEISKKEVTLKIENDKDWFKFKLFFDIDGNNCVAETRATQLREGIYRLKNKTNKIINSYQRNLKQSESIRTLDINSNEKEKEYEFKYRNLDSIDKPIGEKDAKSFILENRIDIIMFENIDKDNSICIMKKERDKFYLYITSFYTR